MKRTVPVPMLIHPKPIVQAVRRVLRLPPLRPLVVTVWVRR